MQKSNVIHLPNVEAKSWRVQFKLNPTVADERTIAIHDPRNIFARYTPADIRTPPATVTDDGGRSLAVLWMPPGASPDLETSWIADIPAASTASSRVVRAGLRTARVVWTDTRAIIYAAAEQLDEALDAVARFTVVERDTRVLEAKMASLWPCIDRDTRLTHTVRQRDQWLRKGKVNRLTDNVTQMASAALRLEASLEQLDPGLQSNSKRLFAELALQAELEDRLELLGEPIDFAVEHYELINSRMIEAKQASSSLTVEVAILVALLGDLAFIAYPYVVGT
ncbi:hypothetical protein G3545_08785 [Starkeya sp. ORNL1]|uniref:hypothetical protein n=1 Tax=Starkeya sp. ORNL1 TaxID=2709380 RepID=UPI001463DF47|nr:hypothetical protein [Starkeya sp. ORNL1]QJP13744.1 hypothetical protein G3545_08785 [Starkeya sp. ORNL1]